jgi:hypothetical protein
MAMSGLTNKCDFHQCARILGMRAHSDNARAFPVSMRAKQINQSGACYGLEYFSSRSPWIQGSRLPGNIAARSATSQATSSPQLISRPGQ